MKKRDSIAILSDKSGTNRLSYAFSVDDLGQTTQEISAPVDDYLEHVLHLVWRDENYIFGGETDFYKVVNWNNQNIY